MAQESINVYCIGLYKTKKVISSENSNYIDLKNPKYFKSDFLYFPQFEIGNITKDDKNVSIEIKLTDDDSMKLTYSLSPDQNLLNTTASTLISDKIMPNITLDLKPSITVDEDIQSFFDLVTNKQYLPFCIVMQFYMNPYSLLKNDYFPYHLLLMEGLTKTPQKEQKGELMCNVNLESVVGSDDTIKSFKSFMTTRLKPTKMPPKPINGKYESSEFKTEKSKCDELEKEIAELREELKKKDASSSAPPKMPESSTKTIPDASSAPPKILELSTKTIPDASSSAPPKMPELIKQVVKTTKMMSKLKNNASKVFSIVDKFSIVKELGELPIPKEMGELMTKKTKIISNYQNNLLKLFKEITNLKKLSKKEKGLDESSMIKGLDDSSMIKGLLEPMMKTTKQMFDYETNLFKIITNVKELFEKPKGPDVLSILKGHDESMTEITKNMSDYIDNELKEIANVKEIFKKEELDTKEGLDAKEGLEKISILKGLYELLTEKTKILFDYKNNSLNRNLNIKEIFKKEGLDESSMLNELITEATNKISDLKNNVSNEIANLKPPFRSAKVKPEIEVETLDESSMLEKKDELDKLITKTSTKIFDFKKEVANFTGLLQEVKGLPESIISEAEKEAKTKSNGLMRKARNKSNEIISDASTTIKRNLNKIYPSRKVNPVTTGGGLKRSQLIQTTIPRIYRQVFGPYERRTDYYNYA